MRNHPPSSKASSPLHRSFLFHPPKHRLDRHSKQSTEKHTLVSRWYCCVHHEPAAAASPGSGTAVPGAARPTTSRCASWRRISTSTAAAVRSATSYAADAASAARRSSSSQPSHAAPTSTRHAHGATTICSLHEHGRCPPSSRPTLSATARHVVVWRRSWCWAAEPGAAAQRCRHARQAEPSTARTAWQHGGCGIANGWSRSARPPAQPRSGLSR